MDNPLVHMPLSVELRKQRVSLDQALSRPMVRSLAGEAHLDLPLLRQLIITKLQQSNVIYTSISRTWPRLGK